MNRRGKSEIAVGLLALLAIALPATGSARAVDEVSLTPRVAIGGSTGVSGLPGQTVSAAQTVRNTATGFGFRGDIDFQAPLTITSDVKGWWVSLEARQSNGTWQSLAGFSRAASGYSLVQPAPSSTGLSVTATPSPALAVGYPSEGDRVIGTHLIGLATARWALAVGAELTPTAVNTLMSAAQNQDVRVRWRVEARNTNIFGQTSASASTSQVSFKGMLRSQSSAARLVQLTVTGDGRTQSFSSSNLPGLSSIAPGASVPVPVTAKLPSIPAKGASESDAAYKSRLQQAASSATTLSSIGQFKASGAASAAWWWLLDNDPAYEQAADRTITLTPLASSASTRLPIVSVAKSGPVSAGRGTTVVYLITATNTGTAQATPVVTDTIDGLAAAPVAIGLIATGEAVSGSYTYAVPNNFSATTLHDRATVTWKDAADNSYGPMSTDLTTPIIGDTTPPDPPSITSGAPALSNSTDASFSFTGEPGGTYQCRLDAAAWQPCTSPKTYSSLSQGAHSFNVRQLDADQNVGQPSEFPWTVDSIAPATPVLVNAPSGLITLASVLIVFEGESGGTFECQLDSGSWGVCASPRSSGLLAEGPHAFSVRQRDAANNVGPTALATWELDSTPPAIPNYIATPNEQSASSVADFEFTGDAGAEFECSLDGADFDGCASPVFLENLGEQVHRFEVRAVDAAGNRSAPTEFIWTIDFEENQCRAEITESQVLRVDDEAGPTS